MTTVWIVRRKIIIARATLIALGSSDVTFAITIAGLLKAIPEHRSADIAQSNAGDVALARTTRIDFARVDSEGTIKQVDAIVALGAGCIMRAGETHAAAAVVARIRRRGAVRA